MKNKQQLPKVVLFDWDNTLVDSWESTYQCINYVLKVLGLQPRDYYEIKDLLQNSTYDFFTDLFENYWEDAKILYHSLIEFYILEFGVNPLPHIDKLFSFCAENNIPIALVSNKEHRVLEVEVRILGIRDKFFSIMGSAEGEGRESKPAPDMLELTVNKLNYNVPKEDIWMIGDSLIDVEAANNFGCKGILYGKADVVINRNKEKEAISDGFIYMSVSDHSHLLDVLSLKCFK